MRFADASSKILKMGIDAGRIGLHLAKLGYNIFGVDISIEI
jgi:hypothetical protein